MSEDHTPNADNSNAFDDFLRRMLGDDAAEEARRALQSQGFDPDKLSGQFADPQALERAFSQFQSMMNTTSGPVNWRLVQDGARQLAYQSGDPAPSAAQAERARQAMSIADLWLDAVTDFSPGVVHREVWSRTQWIDSTVDMWKRICEPVALNVARALNDSMGEQLKAQGFSDDDPSIPSGLQQMLGQTHNMIPKLSSMMFGAQIGNTLAALSKEALGSFDVGIPLVRTPVTALVVHNIEEFGDGLDIPFEEIQQFMAVRESAHRRLFSSVPWLEGDLMRAVEKYSAEIAVDMSAISEAARNLDLSDQDALEQAFSGGIFTMNISPSQEETLEHLETLLALVEGWVEVVTDQAVTPYLPHAAQLRETMRRRRATGGPAEDMLSTLIGLRMRPRRARSAASIFTHVFAEGNAQAREALWAHPDVVPNAQELDSPDTFLTMRHAAREQDADIDAALNSLLDGTMGWAQGLSPDDDPEAETLHRAGFTSPSHSLSDASPSSSHGGVDVDDVQGIPPEQSPSSNADATDDDGTENRAQ